MITPLHSCLTVPTRPCCLDVETSSVGDTLDIGFCWEDIEGTQHYKVFSCWGDWWDFWLNLYKTAPKDRAYKEYLRRVYAHNGAAFDWLCLYDYFRSRGKVIKLKAIASGSIHIGLDIKIGNTRDVSLKLRDSLRLLPTSLKNLCKYFDVEHGKGEVPKEYISKMELYREQFPDEYYEYLRNDVLGLSEVLFKFHSLIVECRPGIGKLPMTLPSLAMKLFRLDLKVPIMTPWGKRQKALEREGYYGGRVECFEMGRFNATVDDVNSMYPFVMRNNDFPSSYVGSWCHDYRGQHGVYRLRYEQTNRDIPPLLYDTETRKYSYTGFGVYYQPEIAELLAVGGRIVEVIEGYVYREVGPIFREFVDFWYGIRRQAIEDGQEALAYTCKIMLNSLYGKFGQREESSVLKELDSPESTALIMDPDVKTKVYDNVIEVVEPTHSESTFVGIAGYVTCYARIELHRRMRQAKEQGHTVYYCDTDSVHHSGATYERSNNLGSMKLETKDTAIYLGKKLYAFKAGSVKAKGIGRNIVEGDLSYSTFEDLLEGRIPSIEITFMAATTPAEVYKQGQLPAVFVKRKRTLRSTG